MNVSIGARWAGFVENAVKGGRYGSASEVVREGLRLVEEREMRLAELRSMLDASVAEGGGGGGGGGDDSLDAVLDAKAAELAKSGF